MNEVSIYEKLDICTHNNFKYEEKVVAVGNSLIEEKQVDCPVIHRFGPGTYIREVKIPKDTFAIGHYQKKEHLNIFLKGKVTMLNEDGTTSNLEAPMIFTSKPGRKCGYIHEDVVWLNVYPTGERDVEKLESEFLDKSAIQPIEEDSIKRSLDIADYNNALCEFGFTEETAREQSENETDQIPFPDGGYKVAVFKSNIEGKGLFATADIDENEEIAPARLKGMRTPAGRYTNHSQQPNAIMKVHGDDIYLIATKKIKGMRGGVIGDEITTNYRKSLELQTRSNQCLL